MEARDIAHVLHCATDAVKHAEIGPTVIERGDGVFIYDSEGKRYLEGMSGMWSAGLGFSEKRLGEAAKRQMDTLPFYHIFAHRSTPVVIDLSEKLIEMAPVPMSKVFFTNSGSEANDTVMKFLWYRARAMGQPEKRKILTRYRAYHGATIGTVCLTGLEVNHRNFDLLVSDVVRLTCPHLYREGLPGETEEEFSTRLANELEQKILAEGPETVAAFIAEAGYGRRRRDRSARGLLGEDAGGSEEVRRPADRRRGDQRLRPDRQDVRQRALRHGARRHGRVEAADLVLHAVRGDPDERQVRRPDHQGHPRTGNAGSRVHQLRTSGRFGRRAGNHPHRGRARPADALRRDGRTTDQRALPLSFPTRWSARFAASASSPPSNW